ncbi:MAG: asparagine synthase (glutamine-hydrolyzing) [bacterium]
MCGIAGFISHRDWSEDVLHGMVDQLRHRGPDSSGFIVDGDYRAGMRRLSINDVSGGDQPLSNTDGSVQLLYNGEIYNSPELRKELEASGVRFHSRSDGEVICHLYDRLGIRLFERLDGMYAVALWDAKRRRLMLARDIPGEKPLYYAIPKPGEIAFASELHALRHYPGLQLHLNLRALWDYPTFLWVPEPETVYEEILALPPGHLLVHEDGKHHIEEIPNRFGPELHSSDDADILAITRATVEEAVESRLLSDVPVGCFLSSGLDSSIIATLAARKLDRLSTFTIGFEDVSDPFHGHADEAPYVEKYAKVLGTDHHTIRVTAEDFRDLLDDFTYYGDQPFGVSSGLGILAVAHAAREAGIKVLLSGDGADEAFGGYSWYPQLGRIGSEVTRGANGQEPVSFQYTSVNTEQLLKDISSQPHPRRAWAWHYYASEADKRLLFHPDMSSTIPDSVRHFASFRNGHDWNPIDYIRHDRRFYFPNEMLRKVDRLAMAESVEGRVPFAAPAVQALADKLSFDQMIRGDTLKWVLRKAFADILPREVVERPKHGFNVPIDHWLKGRWADMLKETFSPSSALARYGLMHPNAAWNARELLEDSRRLTGHTLFCFIQLNRWLEMHEEVAA